MSDSNLITTYSFQGRQFLIKMNINCCLELILTDKYSGEEWECSYETSYIENLTRKTGNFKHFDVFTTMLKSGLLKTSDCVSLELLTYEDLESMRVKKIRNSNRLFSNNNNNRRYLILIYSVEFDRINYPLPLEYCGPPDPAILQATIKRLEAELSKAYEELNCKNNSNQKQTIKALQKRIDTLVMENIHLSEEVKQLRKFFDKKPKEEVVMLQKAIVQLEKNVKSERDSHHKLVEKLQNDKQHLVNQLERTRSSEKSLKSRLQTISQNNMRNLKNHAKLHGHHPQAVAQKKRPSPTMLFKDFSNSVRSRSPSPQIRTWRNDNKINSRNRSKSRSRSSSVSSTKHAELIIGTTETTSSDSVRHGKRLISSCSRSISAESLTDISITLETFKKHTNLKNSKNIGNKIRTVFPNKCY